MTTGIRINELVLVGTAGSGRTYGASFRLHDEGSYRPLSVIAGPSLTGKTSIVDFIRYCLGDDNHPQHPEILPAVRAALLEAELAGERTVIERSATGRPSGFASVWRAGLLELQSAAETRVSAEPPSDPDGLSQLVLASFNLDGIELPDSSVRDETATQLLSIRDMFRVIFVPNERLDNKNLVFEQSHHMVRQKFVQSIEAMFGVHDNEQAVLAARYRAAREAARAAELSANTLRRIAEDEYPRGPMQLAIDLEEATTEIASLEAELAALDQHQRTTQRAAQDLRRTLVDAQRMSAEGRVRVRDRRSLIARLDALRGQYADDKRKLNFLRDAERLFDPLQVVVCPACFGKLEPPPSIQGAHCSLCHSAVDVDGLLQEGAAPVQRADDSRIAVIEHEVRAVGRRLSRLNEYVERLDEHLRVLIDESFRADEAADAAAQAVDDVTDSPAPWLAARDSVTRRIGAARLARQTAEVALGAWRRVADAEANHARLADKAREINSDRMGRRAASTWSEIIGALSERFGIILSAIGYPKLSEPRIADDLVPFVRGLPYTHASSGGTVLISLAWNLSLWEIAHERGADAPGLLVIDSPQKNLGHNSKPGEPDFADTTLVENFYAHAKEWLAGDGAGAQLIVVDNSPPESVADDVVVRFTRDPQSPPYGLITDATT